MAKAKRKLVTMLVTVTVPRDMSASHARREVRTLITDQCNYAAEPGDVKAQSVRPTKFVLEGAAMAALAWGKPKHPKPRKRDGTPPLLAAMEAK